MCTACVATGSCRSHGSFLPFLDGTPNACTNSQGASSGSAAGCAAWLCLAVLLIAHKFVMLVHTYGRSARRAVADGDVAGLSHHLCGHRNRDAAVDDRRRVEVAADERRCLSDARATLGEGHRDLVRGRRCFGNGPLV